MNNRDTLIPKLQAVFLTKSYEEWEPLLLANDIPCGAINDIGQVVEHPQVKARGSIVEFDHPIVGTDARDRQSRAAVENAGTDARRRRRSSASIRAKCCTTCSA